MLRNIDTINKNMNILQKRLENTGANISNVNTPGYKFQNIIQSTMEGHEMVNYSGGPNLDRRQSIGNFVLGNQIDLAYKDFEQGVLNKTDKRTDFALVGNGFFVVELEDGLGFTRNGNFIINDENLLTTTEGYPVIGIDGSGASSQISIYDPDFQIDKYGNFLNNDIKLLVADFEDYQGLELSGDTLFLADGLQYNPIDGDIRQGYLESSNVNVVDEMIRMIEISREFESNQRVLTSIDETLRQTVNEVGKVR